MADIKTVAVIGAGVMGASIAAHCANAGTKVLLLDIVKPGAANRNAIAEGAIEKLKKADPAPLMGSRAVKLITPGNIEDHLPLLADVDWVVEAVIERLDIKQDLYRKLDAVLKPGAIVSSNTSTIPLKELCSGLPDSFTSRFCVTHFFNPPRYMRLLEIVGGASEKFAALQTYADHKLGKTVINCNDTPGFIANRLGTYWIQTAIVLALELGLEVEEADAIMGKPMGFPSTGIFGLMDLVGIDLGPHVNASLARLLPPGDAFHAMNKDNGMVQKLISAGYTGKKGKGGFYVSTRGPDGKRAKTALILSKAAETLEWRPSVRADIPEVKAAKTDLKKLVGAESKYGKYAWGVLGRVLAYSASLVPEIATGIADIDAAMRLGYTWKFGPFELIDKLGGAWVAEHLTALGLDVPLILQKLGDKKFYQPGANGALEQFSLDGTYKPIKRAPGILVLDDIKRTSKAVLASKTASAWDLGDGILCFEAHALAPDGVMRNMLDGEVLGQLGKAMALCGPGKAYKALVLYNDVPQEQPQKVNFSQGANLPQALFAINIRMWSKVETSIKDGQKLYQSMRYAPFPIVGAPVGLALGGGCEMLLHCSAVQAYAESYVGLVEVGVGLVPGWGGCTSLLARWQSDKMMPKGPMPAPAKVFEIISTATVSKSAAEAQELKFFRATDGITMNRDRLLADAKARALAMVDNYAPPEPPILTLPGKSGRVALGMAVDGFAARGIATPHDVTVSGALADVLSGGDFDPLDAVTEDDVMALERKSFMELIRTKESLARIKSIVETGKPLRN
jgi:3-hydroxyacyl-CoA dehydrogenase